MVTGDVVSVEIPIGNWQDFMNNNVSKIVEEAFQQNPHLDPADYDNRDNNNNQDFLIDNSNTQPDGILDYVVLIKKTKTTDASNAGFADFDEHTSLSNVVSQTTGNSYDLGLYHFHDKTKDSKWVHIGLFLHEFGHNIGLYHTGGANDVCYDKFTFTKGWGMITNHISQFWTATAHSMWLFDWLQGNEVKNISSNGPDIILKDLLTSNSGETKAVRVDIPFTDQYLWIENHQKIHPSGFDQPTIFTDASSGVTTSASVVSNNIAKPGIYMYISDKENNLANPSGTRRSSNNSCLLHPNGKHDYVFSLTTNIPDQLIRSLDNPIAGSIIRESYRMDNPNEPSHLGTIRYNKNWNDGNRPSHNIFGSTTILMETG